MQTATGGLKSWVGYKYVRVTSTDPRNTKWNHLECPVTLELGDYNCTPEVEGVPQARHS